MDTARKIVKAYLNGIISEEECRAALEQLGLRLEDVLPRE